VQRYALQGSLPAVLQSIREAPWTMAVPLVGLAAVCLLAGLLLPFYHQVLLDPARDVILTGLDYARMVLGG